MNQKTLKKSLAVLLIGIMLLSQSAYADSMAAENPVAKEPVTVKVTAPDAESGMIDTMPADDVEEEELENAPIVDADIISGAGEEAPVPYEDAAPEQSYADIKAEKEWKKWAEEDTPELLRFKNARDEAAVQMKKIAGSLSDPGKLLRAWQASLPYEEQLLQLSEQLFLRYRQIKQRHDCLDFGDFEHYAYAILTAHDGMIADQLASRYQEIMVDEFQDTSESQWQLISLLARDDLFLVGDVKQSIYRFRNAKPAIMQRLNEDPSFRKIHIRSNYRSKANIISFNNALF